jgi:hypothetical protein
MMVAQSTSTLDTLLGTQVAGLVARRISPLSDMAQQQMTVKVAQLVEIIEAGTLPISAITNCLPEVESLVLANPEACLPLLAAIERRATGLLDTMPLLAERLNHIRKGADIAELFSRDKLRRLEKALLEYQETTL